MKKRSPAKRSIGITGVCHFPGNIILKYLEESDRYPRILALDINRPPFPLVKTVFHKIDLTSPDADEQLTDIFKKEGLHTLLHFAFSQNPSKNPAHAHDLEAIGTMYLLNACEEAKVAKIVTATTTMVYGANPDNPNYIKESWPIRGSRESRFIKDRVDIENQLRSYRKGHPETVVTVLRPCTILGPMVRNFQVRYFSRLLVPTILGFDPLVQLLHEADFIEVLKRCIENDFSGEYNIAGDGVLPLSTIVKMSGKIRYPIPLILARTIFRTLWLMNLTSIPPSFVNYLCYLWVADTRKMKEEIGFRPGYSTKETLLSFIETMRLREIRLVE